MKRDTAWGIYSKELMKREYGYPLWMPDQPPDGVMLGDVGMLQKGEFQPFFNAMKTGALQNRPVPPGFVPLEGLSILEPRECIRQRILCSGTTHDTSVSIKAETGSPGTASGGAGLSYKFRSSSGALLIPHPSVEAEDIQSILHVEEYMQKNFGSWLELSEDRGIPIDLENVHFVIGTKKTVRWMVAAFQGEHNCTKGGSMTATLAPGAIAGSLGIAVSSSDGQLAQEDSRYGPMPRVADYVDEMLAMSTDFSNTLNRAGRAPSPSPRAMHGPGPSKHDAKHGEQTSRNPKRRKTQGAKHGGENEANEEDEDRDDAQNKAKKQSGAEQNVVHDQCVFIHTIRLKKRRSPFIMLSNAAGPYEITLFPPPMEPDQHPRRAEIWSPQARAHPEAAPGPLPSPGIFSRAMSRIRSIFRRPPAQTTLPDPSRTLPDTGAEPDHVPEDTKNLNNQAADPVYTVMDYILTNSPAEVALASDRDLHVLLRDEPGAWPEDWDAVLSRLKPQIIVDVRGAGRLYCREDFRYPGQPWATSISHTASAVSQPIETQSEHASSSILDVFATDRAREGDGSRVAGDTRADDRGRRRVPSLRTPARIVRVFIADAATGTRNAFSTAHSSRDVSPGSHRARCM